MGDLTYKKAGVDIERAGEFKEKIKSLARQTFSGYVLKDIGSFGGFFSFPKDKYKEPILVASADGVGTKVKIAQLVNKHDTVGIDLVAMNVNDILCSGAKPLFFLDYIAYFRLKEEILQEIIKGIVRGCSLSECALIGGETAQMPDVYKTGEYDLAGFCVGVIEKSDIIDGSNIEIGDLAIGLESNGLHSNGFSLVRKVFSEKELKRMSEELLKPTRIYVREVLSLLYKFAVKQKRYNIIRGIAHITGGAFYEKLKRVLPQNLNLRINKSSWTPHKIFYLIQNKADIEDREMYRTFNMGIGMVLIIKRDFALTVKTELSKFNLRSYIIGEVVKGKGEVEII